MTVRERQASGRARRKKRGRKLMIAYALQDVIFLLLALMIVLMVCGELYIREHLAHAPDIELPDGNMGTDDPALSEPPIVPIEPAIPGEVTIPDWIVQDILPVNEYSRPGIALSEVNGVVVHYTGNPGTTAEQNRSYYKNLAETKETYEESSNRIGKHNAEQTRVDTSLVTQYRQGNRCAVGPPRIQRWA